MSRMSSEESRLEAARELMGQKKYDAARRILRTMPDNPQAQSWLITLDQLSSAGSRREEISDYALTDSDPYGQEEFLTDEGEYDYPAKAKRGPGVLERGLASGKHYAATAVITLILYWAFWPVGLVANIIYLKEARQLRASGVEVQGVGCLVALLTLHVLLPCALILFLILVAPSAWETVEEIMAEIGAQ